MNDELKDNVDTFPIDNCDGSSPCTDFDYFCTKVTKRDNNLFKKRMRTKGSNQTQKNQSFNKKRNVSELNSNPNSQAKNKKKSNSPSTRNVYAMKGKLSPEEYKGRVDNNLCLYCGKGGHCIGKCPARKARASEMKTQEDLVMEEK